MHYRQVNKSEYKILAAIHIKGFKDFFLASLGAGFLNTYYKACLKSDEVIAVCAANEQNQLLGFGMGCPQSKGFHKKLMMRNFFPFFIQGLILLLTKPRALIRLINNFDKIADKNDDGNYAELLSIVIIPEAKKMGIGEGMIKYFEEMAKLKGCKKITLTTDYDNNDYVVNFYKKNGYSVLYEFNTYPNRRMYKMIKEIKL
jgi:ribosomal protein S18 acetylase RimI-like enzyme